MLNKEKFKDEIVDIACDGRNFAVKIDVEKVVCDCIKSKCSQCIFSDENNPSSDVEDCYTRRRKWAKSEYVEYVDWPKVPVDTKIFVRSNEKSEWVPRHFSKYENGKVYAFNYGNTSFTINDNDDVSCWPYAKLYKKGE